MSSTLDSLVAQVRAGSRAMVRELGLLDSRLPDFEISNSQCHALIELEQSGVLTSAALAERLNLDRSSMSRLLKPLLDENLISARQDASDRRKKPLQLTAKGKKKLTRIHRWADQTVRDALAQMSEEHRQQLADGLGSYAKALRQSRRQAEFSIRPIERKDSAQVAALIRAVMPEFGADGPGFAIHDPEVNAMYKAYSAKGAAYFVLCEGHDKRAPIVGGGGYGNLEGGPPGVCELRKMYFLPPARGLGLGRKLLRHILQAAKDAGYQRCYLETLKSMARAQRLYEQAGFQTLETPLGATGHFGCDRWMVKVL